MRLSIIIIILMLSLVGLLMIIGAANMKDKEARAVRDLLFVLGAFCIVIGLYVLFEIYLPAHGVNSIF